MVGKCEFSSRQDSLDTLQKEGSDACGIAVLFHNASDVIWLTSVIHQFKTPWAGASLPWGAVNADSYSKSNLPIAMLWFRLRPTLNCSRVPLYTANIVKKLASPRRLPAQFQAKCLIRGHIGRLGCRGSTMELDWLYHGAVPASCCFFSWSIRGMSGADHHERLKNEFLSNNTKSCKQSHFSQFQKVRKINESNI